MVRKVLITSRSFGNISDRPFDVLKASGYTPIKLEEGFAWERFEEEILDAEALIIGAHDFPVELMKRCSKLKIVCKHGAGLDNIHIKEAKSQGIIVCNAPGTNKNAVADLVFGLMLNVARKINLTSSWVHEGKWKTAIGLDVYNKTLGIIGLGSIGQCVAKRAAGFSMKILAYDSFIDTVPEELATFVKLTDKETLLRESNFLTLHVPLTEDTRNLITKKEMELMPNNSIIINTSRGGIVNEKDLLNMIEAGHVFGAGLDVTEQEPIDKNNPLLHNPNVIITPHIGMYSKEAIEAVSLICAENVSNLKNPDNLVYRVC